MAVDEGWRLYINPNFVEPLTVEEIEGVLAHELNHVLRFHTARRVDGISADAWNIATDAEINDDLEEDNLTLPEDAVLPELLDWPRHEAAEEYAQRLMSEKKSEDSAESENGSDGNGGSDGSGGKKSENGSDGSGGKKSENKSEDGSDGSDGSDGGSDGSDGSDGGSDGSDGSEKNNKLPHPQCGSGAHGVKESWELPDDSDTPGLSQAEADLVRRRVAEEIVKHESSNGIGSVPGGLKRFAESILTPKIDWQLRLGGLIQASLADTMGKTNYTWSRPSRRASVVAPAVIPSLRAKVPNAAVVVDTSGSMGDDMLSQAVGEISGILQSSGGRATIIATDSDVHAVESVTTASLVPLEGGGGTDMGVGLDAAGKLSPPPDIVIVITDGYTPWPTKSPLDCPVVVATFGDPGPSWAETVTIE
jgi:predicted metal-dependent peptidase